MLKQSKQYLSISDKQDSTEQEVFIVMITTLPLDPLSQRLTSSEAQKWWAALPMSSVVCTNMLTVISRDGNMTL